MSKFDGSSSLDVLVARIQSEMAARNWSQADLADASGVSQKNISNILRGESDTTIATAEALARAVGLDLVGALSEPPAIVPLKTIQEIRHDQYAVMMSRFDTINEMAAATGKAPALLSQIKNGQNLGDKLARDLEDVLGYPTGWLDNPSVAPLPARKDDALDYYLAAIRSLALKEQKLPQDEAELLEIFRSLSSKSKVELIRFARFQIGA